MKIMQKMIDYFGYDVKRVNHAVKVYAFAKTIAELEDVDNDILQIIEASAILHDIGIKVSETKYGSSSGKHQEIEGPPIAREILIEFGIDNHTIERICFIIGNHHSYSKIDGIDFQILVEADFIVNIYEDQLDNKQISLICEKYFKTNAGIGMLKSLYLKCE